MHPDLHTESHESQTFSPGKLSSRCVNALALAGERRKKRE
jgi:hypothetical protein